MRHLPQSRAYARSHRRIWLTVSLVGFALGCGDVTSPVTPHASSDTRTSHETLNTTNTTELASLTAAVDDARPRLIAPLSETPEGHILAKALVRLAGALAIADSPAARQTLPALDLALASLTRAIPATAPDIDALRLIVLHTTRALDTRVVSGGPRAPTPARLAASSWLP